MKVIDRKHTHTHKETAEVLTVLIITLRNRISAITHADYEADKV